MAIDKITTTATIISFRLIAPIDFSLLDAKSRDTLIGASALNSSRFSTRIDAHITSVGTIITKQAPDFDPRTFGYAKLSDLVRATELFEIEKRDKAVLVRDGRR